MHRIPFHRPRHLPRSSERGSVLMIALLLVLLGTFGITAWFGLIAARSLEVSAKEEAMIRRVQLNGVKEIARQVASQAFLSDDDGTTAATNANLPGTLGKVSLAPWSGTPYTNLAQLRYDQIGGLPGKSFSIDVAASLDDGHGAVGSVDYSVQLRTYVPALNGDLLTIHEPAVAATPVITDPGLLVNGRSVVWDGGNALAHKTERLHLSGKASTVSLVNLAGNAVLPDNETFAGRSTGNDFVGRIKKISTSESTANRYTARLSALGFVTIPAGVTMGDITIDGYRADNDPFGNQRVSIQLDHPALPNLLIESRRSIGLTGQVTAAEFAAAGALAPRLIIVADPSGGSSVSGIDVKFGEENNRPLVFAVSRGTTNLCNFIYAFNGTPASFPRWRMIFEFENCPVTFSPDGSGVSEVHVRGGISTDASIDTALLPVRLLSDSSAGLEAIASRTGFVQIYRN